MSREDHGYNSPSQLWRCRMCPGSVRMLRGMVTVPLDDDGLETGSLPARKGTYQHEDTRYYYANNEHLPPPESLKDEMTDRDFENVEWCVDKTREIVSACGSGAILLWERQLDLSGLGIDGGKHGCRGDLLVIVPGEFVAVIDYKYGFKWVPAPRYNDQFRSYVWGAWDSFGGHTFWPIKMQPNLPDNMKYSDCRFSVEEIPAIGDDIRGVIAATEEPDAPLVRGDHCGFCGAWEVCPKWTETALEIPRHVTIFKHLSNCSPKERGKLVDNLYAWRKWCDHAIKSCSAFAFAYRGREEIDGYEIGPGRSERGWKDRKTVLRTLRKLATEKGKDYKLLYEPPKPAEPVSPHKATEVLGKSKAVMDALAQLIETKPGEEILKPKRGG